jgi:nucleoside-diphosphate-sugar epimerase
MRVLVLGGTGSIGSAIVTALTGRGHAVVALARSANSAARLEAMGAEALAGDIRAPDAWLPVVDRVDGVIHAAADFGSDMATIDRGLLAALLPRMTANARDQALLYTGGCWLYGATGDAVATEASRFDPLPAFAWMVAHLQMVLAAAGIRGIVIHPGMVYAGREGVFARFADDAREIGRVRVVGSERVRWALIHRQDLANLYVLALERGVHGTSYNAAVGEGMPVGSIARAIANRFGVSEAPILRSADEVAAELGDWARGYALDQQMSGAAAQRDLGWHPVYTDPIAELD